ncbi:MAG: hypothetical protein Q9183_004124 [Haloplaca sp. 2 TL-2023]
MTEPEELDEDLFADLYDADEPASTAAPPAQPVVAPEPVESATPVTTVPPVNDFGDESNNNAVQPVDHDQAALANGQDEREEPGWENGGRGSRMDVAVEQDNGGVGIKEDG